MNRAPVDDAERLAREIDIYPSSDGKRHYQRRAHEEVRFHALVNACLEVAVPRKHAGTDNAAFGEGFLDLAIQRP
jgi:hypothetical protein